MPIIELVDLINGDDVWVIERRGCAGLLLKAAPTLCIHSEICGQQLERYFATQLAVVGQINFSHATRAEQVHYLVMTDILSGREPGSVGHEQPGDHVEGRRVNEAQPLLVAF